MLRFLSLRGALRFDSSVGGERATTFWARWEVSSCRDSSNSVPDQPSPGPPGTRSRHPRALSGATVRLERGAKGSGSTTYLSGLVAVAIGTVADL